MKILVTGGSGFIGASVIDNLINTDHKILAISRKKKISINNITWVKADLSKKNSYSQYVINFNPEVIIHFYWDKIPNFSKKISNQNLKNSKNFFEFIFKKTECKKLIISGSCFEYSKKIGSCNERQKCIPKDYFTSSKLNLLEWTRKNSKKYNYDFAWFRIFYAYGPKQRKDSLIPYIIRSLKNREKLNLSNPYANLDFINIEDVSRYIIKSIDVKFRSGIYNIGSGKSIQILKIYKIIKKILLLKNDQYFDYKKISVNLKKNLNFYADITKSVKTFNIKNKISIKEGISKIINEN
jgi:UDP-glucose 4-epimerase